MLHREHLEGGHSRSFFRDMSIFRDTKSIFLNIMSIFRDSYLNFLRY